MKYFEVTVQIIQETTDKKQPQPKPQKSIAESNKKLGLHEFSYGDNKLWALNKTNADRKAKKLGWI